MNGKKNSRDIMHFKEIHHTCHQPMWRNAENIEASLICCWSLTVISFFNLRSIYLLGTSWFTNREQAPQNSLTRLIVKINMSRDNIMCSGVKIIDFLRSISRDANIGASNIDLPNNVFMSKNNLNHLFWRSPYLWAQTWARLHEGRIEVSPVSP